MRCPGARQPQVQKGGAVAADQAMEVTRVPEPVASTATRVKRQRVHKLALGGKRRRDGAAFDAGRLPCHKSFRRGYERRACS